MAYYFTSYRWPWRSSWQNWHLPLYLKRGMFALALPGLAEEAGGWATGRRAGPRPSGDSSRARPPDGQRWQLPGGLVNCVISCLPRAGRSTEGLYVRCTCPVSSTIDLRAVGSQEPRDEWGYSRSGARCLVSHPQEGSDSRPLTRRRILFLFSSECIFARYCRGQKLHTCSLSSGSMRNDTTQ